MVLTNVTCTYAVTFAHEASSLASLNIDVIARIPLLQALASISTVKPNQSILFKANDSLIRDNCIANVCSFSGSMQPTTILLSRHIESFPCMCIGVEMVDCSRNENKREVLHTRVLGAVCNYDPLTPIATSLVITIISTYGMHTCHCYPCVMILSYAAEINHISQYRIGCKAEM